MNPFGHRLSWLAPSPARHVIRRWIRTVEATNRSLPDFVIIGAQRSGTTSLYSYLSQHPNMISTRRKEIHFFDTRNYEKGMAWYRNWFPHLSAKTAANSRNGDPMISGEATPCYLVSPQSPARAWNAIPDAKLIVLLRNPVDRAYSHYHYNLKAGYENKNASFEEALAKEPERLGNNEALMRQNPTYYSFDYRMLSYLKRGLYVEQIETWMQYFSRDQFLILKSEALYADPASVLNRVYGFLGLPPYRLSGYDALNPTNHTEMNPETRARLIAYFQPYNQRLYELLGTDFGWED